MGHIVVKQSVDKLPLERVGFIPNTDISSTSFISSEDSFGMLSAGITELKSGGYDCVYHYDELIFVLDGEFQIDDLDEGKTYNFRKGDMGFVIKGTNTRTSTRTGGKAIFCTIPPWQHTNMVFTPIRNPD